MFGSLCDNGAADSRIVTVEVLGRTVNRQIRTKIQRLLVIRRQERVVDRVHDAGSLSNLGDRGNIGQLHRRVGRCLGQDERRIVFYACSDRLRIRSVGKSKLDAEAIQHLCAQAVRSAIRDIGDDRMIAPIQKSQHDPLYCRHASAETGAVGPAFQFRQL